MHTANCTHTWEDKLNKQLFTINSSVFCPSRVAKRPATPHGRASVVRWGTAHLQGVFSHKNQKLKSCRLEYENTFQWYMGVLSHSECVRSDKSVLLGVISTCDSLCCLQMWFSERFYLAMVGCHMCIPSCHVIQGNQQPYNGSMSDKRSSSGYDIGELATSSLLGEEQRAHVRHCHTVCCFLPSFRIIHLNQKSSRPLQKLANVISLCLHISHLWTVSLSLSPSQCLFSHLFSFLPVSLLDVSTLFRKLIKETNNVLWVFKLFQRTFLIISV